MIDIDEVLFFGDLHAYEWRRVPGLADQLRAYVGRMVNLSEGTRAVPAILAFPYPALRGQACLVSYRDIWQMLEEWQRCGDLYRAASVAGQYRNSGPATLGRALFHARDRMEQVLMIMHSVCLVLEACEFPAWRRGRVFFYVRALLGIIQESADLPYVHGSTKWVFGEHELPGRLIEVRPPTNLAETIDLALIETYRISAAYAIVTADPRGEAWGSVLSEGLIEAVSKEP